MEKNGHPIGFVKDTKSKSGESQVVRVEHPLVAMVLDKVPDEAVKLDGRFTTKHKILRRYIVEEAMAQQYVKAGKGKSYNGPASIAKTYYDFNNFPWDKYYQAMLESKRYGFKSTDVF
jgi:hypothetical protein